MNYGHKILAVNILGTFRVMTVFSSNAQSAGKNLAEPSAVNRFAKFHELPLTTITPEGWLRVYLENQRNGLTGHLNMIGWPFDSDCWEGNEAGKGPHASDNFIWGAYEHTGYRIDEMIRCGYLLNDDFLIREAKRPNAIQRTNHG